MTRLRAVILDFDGVLLESNDVKTRAFDAVFSRFPEHHDEMMAFHDANVSLSRFDKFRYLVTSRLGRPADDPLVDELGASFSQTIRREMETCGWVPGAQSFLDRVRGRLPLFLASVTPQAELDAIVQARGLGKTFDAVYGCPPWTKPRALADIVSRLGGAAGLVFVGDSAGDQRAAALSGVEFLARDSGLAFDDPRPRAYPDMAAVSAAIAHRLP